MLFVLLGCLSFAPLYIFDYLKLNSRARRGGALFFLGCAGICSSTIGAFFSGSARFSLYAPLWWAAAALALCFALGMIWALFFALPFSRTYIEGKGGGVVDTGLYALCRHPGVVFFMGLYLCLWALSGRDAMLLAALGFSFSDILHVWVQDKYFFPKTLAGYEEYRAAAPFLIPTGQSVKRCFDTLVGKEATKIEPR